MTKQEKIASLERAMTRSERDDETEFYHFTDDAPKELVDLFLQEYEVKELDYEIFSRACDIVLEAYRSKKDIRIEDVESYIYDNSEGVSSPYIFTRLSYLDNWTQYEISEIMKEYLTEDIQTACAIWYDRQVEQAAMLIKSWIEN